MMNLVDTFKEFSSGKSIDSPTMVRVLEDVFRTLIKKKYTTDENFDIIVNANKGDLELWRVRDIVPDGEVTDELSQISFSEAIAVDDDYEVGEECYEQLFLEDFGRRSIMAARQTLISRIMDLEKDEIYRSYTERVGELVLCEVQQILKREVLVIDDAKRSRTGDATHRDYPWRLLPQGGHGEGRGFVRSRCAITTPWSL